MEKKQDVNKSWQGIPRQKRVKNENYEHKSEGDI